MDVENPTSLVDSLAKDHKTTADLLTHHPIESRRWIQGLCYRSSFCVSAHFRLENIPNLTMAEEGHLLGMHGPKNDTLQVDQNTTQLQANMMFFKLVNEPPKTALGQWVEFCWRRPSQSAGSQPHYAVCSCFWSGRQIGKLRFVDLVD